MLSLKPHTLRTLLRCRQQRWTAVSAATAHSHPSLSASRPPAAPGDRVENVDTPALLLDLDGAHATGAPRSCTAGAGLHGP